MKWFVEIRTMNLTLRKIVISRQECIDDEDARIIFGETLSWFDLKNAEVKRGEWARGLKNDFGDRVSINVRCVSKFSKIQPGTFTLG